MPFKNSAQHTNEVVAPSDQIQKGMELDRDWMHYVTTHMKRSLIHLTGIDPDQGGFNRDERGALRIFELTPEGEVLDVMGEIRPDSNEFVEKIQQGRIFAFPAGEDVPIQLQIRGERMAASKPIPESPVSAPTPPTGWMRFVHFFGGYKKEFEAYDAAVDKYNKLKAGIESARDERRRDAMEAEAKSFEKDEKDREKDKELKAQEKEHERLRQLQGPAEGYVGKERHMLDVIQQYYATKPVMHDDYVGSRYTLEQFGKLKEYDITKLDVKGAITERQFMALGMLGAMRPENGGQLRLQEGADPELHGFSANTFYTVDLSRSGGSDDPREGVGYYFERGVQAGRQTAKDAIEQYQAGKKDALAQLIGKGLHNSQKYSPHADSASREAAARNGIVAGAVELLDRDPELMEKAKTAGLTDEDLERCRADLKLLELMNQSEWATERLKAADEGKIQLTPEERKACVEARLKLAVLDQQIKTEAVELASTPQAEALQLKQINEREALFGEQKKYYRKIQEQQKAGKLTEAEARKLIDANKVEIDQQAEAMTNLHLTREIAQQGQPKVFQLLGSKDGDAMLQGLVEHHFPGREKLYAMNGQELQSALRQEALFANNSPARTPVPPAPVPRVEAPVKQQEPEQIAQEQQEGEGPVAG